MFSHQAVLEGSPLAFALTEGETHVLCYVNPAFTLLCGSPGEVMRGRSFAELFAASGEDDFLALLDRVYRTGEAGIVMDLERIDAESGARFWSCSAWRVAGSEGSAPMLLIQVSDAVAAKSRPRSSVRSMSGS
jgi:PAS domain S-box-containing protein